MEELQAYKVSFGFIEDKMIAITHHVERSVDVVDDAPSMVLCTFDNA